MPNNSTQGSSPSPNPAPGQTAENALPQTGPSSREHTTRIVLEQKESSRWPWARLLFLALVIAIGVILWQQSAYQQYYNPATGPQESFHSLNPTAKKKIAIINVVGAIMSSDGYIKKQIDRATNDPDVVAVILRIDSPGGTVAASDYLYHRLNQLRDERDIPIVVSMGGICASGGYYLAMAVGDTKNAIFAEPATWTGSIGVVIPHYDISGLLKRFDVKDDSIASHQNKLMGSPTRLLDDEKRKEERKLLQSLVDNSFDRFKKIVQSGRPAFREDTDALDAIATGQVFSSDQAKEKGLVDSIGFIEDAIARAAELANVSAKNVRCVQYKKQPGLLDSLVGVSSEGFQNEAAKVITPESALQWLLNQPAPRAYYLWK